jgi:chorismate--pyruvate lyase
MSRSVAYARWVSNVKSISPSRNTRDWLTDRVSLTAKLIAHSRRFRVRRLHQKTAICLADEHGAVGLPNSVRVHERDVLLQCDDVSVVYAHTIVPLQATASDWPFFSSLGERSLGTTLFGDPKVMRGQLQFARLRPHHPLLRRASKALGIDMFTSPLYARRCLFRRKKGLLLVTEVFLPAINNLTRVKQRRTEIEIEKPLVEAMCHPAA